MNIGVKLNESKLIADMIQDGYLEHILISQDVCFKMDLQRYGGWGYDHILTHIVPMFYQVSVGDDSIRQIMEVNASRALTIRQERMRDVLAKDRRSLVSTIPDERR